MKELTERQRQVMEQVAMGRTYKEAACELGITEHGFRNHVYKVLRKLNARSGLHAIVILDDYRPNWRRMIALP